MICARHSRSLIASSRRLALGVVNENEIDKLTGRLAMGESQRTIIASLSRPFSHVDMISKQKGFGGTVACYV